MATRQVPVAGYPRPILILETGTRQVPAAGAAMILETVKVSSNGPIVSIIQ